MRMQQGGHEPLVGLGAPDQGASVTYDEVTNVGSWASPFLSLNVII